jgi:hypothetical protein
VLGVKPGLTFLIMMPLLVKPPTPQNQYGQKGNAGVPDAVPAESTLMGFQQPVCNYKIRNTNDYGDSCAFRH